MAAKKQQKDIEFGEHVKHANVLLDRESPPGYTEEWTALLMREKEEKKTVTKSTAVIFRLGREWLALSALIFKEVAEIKLAHKLPHKGGRYLIGLVNVRGRLRLCVSLVRLLEIAESTSDHQEQGAFERMVVIERNADQWVFPVDEVHGIYQFDAAQLNNVPVTVAKSTANFLKGMLLWEKKMIGLIDEELLINSLRRVAL